MSNDKKKNSQFMKRDEHEDDEIKRNSLSDLKSFGYLISIAAKYKWKFFISFSLIVISSFISTASARLMGYLVEDGLIKKNLQFAISCAVAIILMEVIDLFGQWIGRKILRYCSSLTVLDIRKRLFDHLQNLPISFYDRRPQGRIVTRVTHDVEGIEDFFAGSLDRLLNAAILGSIIMAAMLITNWRIGLIMIASMIPTVLFIWGTRILVKSVNRKISRFGSALNARLSEYIDGLQVIRSFGIEKWSKTKYDKSVGDHTTAFLNANLMYSIIRPFTVLLCSLPLLFLIWYGGHAVLAGTMTVGIFVTFIRYYERFFYPIMTLARELHVVQKAFANTERVVSFLREETEDEIYGESKKISDVKLKGQIKYDNLSMYYDDDEWVLKKLNLEINSGEKIGVVGTTGCGKTTAVNLLSRLYDYQKGDLYIDDKSIRDYDRDFLRDKIGFVSQDVIIFGGTLRENLVTTNDIAEEEILKSCQITGLSEVMRESNLTLDSTIYDAGNNLSVGERQLIAFTRIILKDPSVLILDEATANIDPKYEKILQSAVDRVMVGRTCIIIAHRLATLKTCDEIVVFNRGEVVEKGPMETLMNQKGHFHKLVKEGGELALS